MGSDIVFFYIYALIAVAGAIGLVLAPKLIHAVMSLFATLFSIAALYLLLGSEFLAAMQLFVYGGAITVLVLFVLMLARPSPEPTVDAGRPATWIAGIACVALFGALAFTLGRAEFKIAVAQPHTAASLAEILFSRYVLPFEIAGLVLTIALIGAIVLAREDDVLETPAEPVTGPVLEPNAPAAEAEPTGALAAEAGGAE